MSDSYLENLRDCSLSLNYIPSGRQLPRTPPLTGVKKHLDFCSEDSNEDHEQPQQNTEQADGAHQDDNNQNTTFDFSTIGTKTEPDEPNSMLKGMKGYQLTQSDLEFIEKMKAEKLIKKLQADLEVVQEMLTKEMMPLELACASRDKAQAELQTFPSCEDLTEWMKVVLKMTSPPSTELTGLDARSLIAMVTNESIQRATDEKRIELARLKKMVASKRKEEAKERGQLEKQFASEQLKIQGLMSQLSDLKSELAQQQEADKALEMQISTQDAPEIKAAEVDTSEEAQATKRQASRRGKGRTKAVKPPEKLQDTTNQSKSTRRLADGQPGVKDDHSHKSTSEAPKTKQKSGAEKPTESVREARGPQRKVKEQESNSQESVRGRKKSPGPARVPAPQPKTQSRVKTGEGPSPSQQAASSRGGKQAAAGAAGDAGEEAQNPVLRRSKRIASRR